jgi:hypothetical protein
MTQKVANRIAANSNGSDHRDFPFFLRLSLALRGAMLRRNSVSFQPWIAVAEANREHPFGLRFKGEAGT